MAIEIERKFLVVGDAWRAQADDGREMRQGYLASDPRSSVRLRISGDEAYLNIKGATVGASRLEFEYPVPRADAEQMLDALSQGPLIEKRRHLLRTADHVWEIDVFHGDNDGLVVAEIELGAVDEPFERPAWLGEEVTDQARYYNACLVRQPYNQWETNA